MRKNLEFAAAVLATFFVISCASTPKPEDTSSKSELAAAQLPDGEYDKSSAKNPEENQTDENAQENSDETPQEKNQNSNPTEKADGKNISKIESSENIGNQNLSQNPPKVQTAPAPRQPNPEPAKKSARGNQNQIPEENSENQKNEDDAKEILFPDEKKSDKNQDDVPAEKINENDLISDLKNEDAPTADEKNKVSEPGVSDFFEEPEVVEAVAEEKNEEIQDSPMENEAVSTQNPAENQKSWPEEIKTETENNPPKPAEENTETPADSASSSENQETEKNENAGTKTEEIVPSRSVTIKQNQYLDVVYPGSGWIYLGENEISRLRYFGRKTENGATAFSFRSIGADSAGSTRNTGGGNSILHFYKNDALTGKYIDDYLEVIVTDENAEKTERTTAPSYAEIVPPRLERRKAEKQEISLSKPVSKEPDENASHPEDFSSPAGKNQNDSAALNSDFSPAREISSNDSLKTVVSNSDSAQNQQNQPGNFFTQDSYLNSNSNIEAEPEVQVSEQSPEDEAAQLDFAGGTALEKARQLFDEKKYAESLENVQNFISGATKRLDEAYYLLGQLYESNSSIKNIKKAVDAYETVTRDFPLSKLWKNASERSIYLKRFYIDIR